MVSPQVLDRIRNEVILSGRDTRYRIEGYGFVLNGLDFYHAKAGELRHFSGSELAKGLVEFADKQFGPVAQSVLAHWGINSTNDFGHIVYNLIDLKLMRKQESDALEDFFNVVDFKEHFASRDCFVIDRAHIRSLRSA